MVGWIGEAEAIGIAVEYLKTIGDAAPMGARMLLAEYVKFLLHRGKYYFPENLPEKMVAVSPKEGKIDRRLAIPLEDFLSSARVEYGRWTKAIRQKSKTNTRSAKVVIRVAIASPSPARWGRIEGPKRDDRRNVEFLFRSSA
jgi:hypothetical protein